METKIGTFHDVLTGEIVVRELTDQEIKDFGQVVDYLSSDAPVDVVVEPVAEELEPVDEE
jgi:hypothetical protein